MLSRFRLKFSPAPEMCEDAPIQMSRISQFIQNQMLAFPVGKIWVTWVQLNSANPVRVAQLDINQPNSER